MALEITNMTFKLGPIVRHPKIVSLKREKHLKKDLLTFLKLLSNIMMLMHNIINQHLLSVLSF